MQIVFTLWMAFCINCVARRNHVRRSLVRVKIIVSSSHALRPNLAGRLMLFDWLVRLGHMVL